MPPSEKTAEMFRADLNDARQAWLTSYKSQEQRKEAEQSSFLAYVDEAGRYADFHALRHTLGSNLAAGGVHPKTAQRLMRHSTITLTMDRYTHVRQEDLAVAVNALPDLFTPRRQTGTMAGTNGGVISVASESSLSPGLSPNAATPRHSAYLNAITFTGTENRKQPGKSERNASISDDWARHFLF